MGSDMPEQGRSAEEPVTQRSMYYALDAIFNSNAVLKDRVHEREALKQMIMGPPPEIELLKLLQRLKEKQNAEAFAKHPSLVRQFVKMLVVRCAACGGMGNLHDTDCPNSPAATAAAAKAQSSATSAATKPTATAAKAKATKRSKKALRAEAAEREAAEKAAKAAALKAAAPSPDKDAASPSPESDPAKEAHQEASPPEASPSQGEGADRGSESEEEDSGGADDDMDMDLLVLAPKGRRPPREAPPPAPKAQPSTAPPAAPPAADVSSKAAPSNSDTGASPAASTSQPQNGIKAAARGSKQGPPAAAPPNQAPPPASLQRQQPRVVPLPASAVVKRANRAAEQCYECGKVGHIRAECPNKQSRTRERGGKPERPQAGSIKCPQAPGPAPRAASASAPGPGAASASAAASAPGRGSAPTDSVSLATNLPPRVSPPQQPQAGPDQRTANSGDRISSSPAASRQGSQSAHEASAFSLGAPQQKTWDSGAPEVGTRAASSGAQQSSWDGGRPAAGAAQQDSWDGSGARAWGKDDARLDSGDYQPQQLEFDQFPTLGGAPPPQRPPAAYAADVASSHSQSYMAIAMPADDPSAPGNDEDDIMGMLADMGVSDHQSRWDIEEAEYQRALEASREQQGPPQAGPGQLSGPSAQPGLSNATGEYNCFLNAIIQCLWQCGGFRAGLLGVNVGFLEGDEIQVSIVTALVQLFQDFLTHEKDPTCAAVNPNRLREALSRKGLAFRMGEMNDASEVLRTLYEALEACGLSDLVTANFGLEVSEAVNCRVCDMRSHLNVYMQYFANVSAAALRGEAAKESPDRPRTLGTRLRDIDDSVYKTCDTDLGGCGNLKQVQRVVDKGHVPSVISLEVGWASMSEAPSDIRATMDAIDNYLDPAEVYKAVEPADKRLRAMVCYYGQHYMAYVQPKGQKEWTCIDDANQRVLGTWAEVRDQCEKGRVQPSVLFFESV
mmetsp:Transcript_6031/g.17259  ORF Transcript_6031/g.17259 Transcript_6031/m.17259 type:complete len:957 (-) Transcript_6031:564-3434(-)|eukprot:CAMPEP_0206144392 /NCGR_PEP_ID=MMETSP1473-20131121/23968_1 /ASSEMBLY_ACC=CAM_ASM_001109 /TAXON_ID=1461547 /ORGANISM="Stichococcus sp, Strain RCC1054" /LENGTH=956 /DNA_ID=CAMNT_0053540207 /DNA_START=115 /DNA_END=2985 /DNA_ORIENTATION=-